MGGTSSGEVRFGLRLDHLVPDRALKFDEVLRDGLPLVMALDGHHDARFAIQIAAHPSPGSPELGRLEVHLLATVGDPEASDPPSMDRVAELADDLLDVLSSPPLRFGVSAVVDEAALTSAFEPLEALHVAEVARREEPCTPVRWSKVPSFQPGDGIERVDRSLWSLWTLGEANPDLRRLASVLLAQEAPVAIRVVVQGTELTGEERAALEQLVMATHQQVADGGMLRASLTTLEALLYVRPLFEVRCLVGSPEPLSRSLLSALGHAISQPAPHGRPDGFTLSGGFAVLRGEAELDARAVQESFASLLPAGPVPSLAPPELSRLRRLLGPWEVANLFRLPVTDDDFPGLTSLTTPELDPPLAELSASGHRVGRLVAHGGQPVRLGDGERFRHLYVSGQTGTGKSTLLLNLALQDIVSGAGVAVLDPHGDLVEAILRNVPDDRLDDVVLVDPADPVSVVGVNLLEAETAVQQEYVVTELCNMFYELFDPHRQGIVGPRFETMLRQAALLLLSHPEQPSSVLDISTLFIDQAVREHLVAGVDDPILSEFWLGEMRMAQSREWSDVVSWFRSKFEIFRTSRLVRNVVGQAESTISFSEVLNDRKIMLVNLSKGLLGEYNSSLIGHIVFTRLWSAALERASMPAAERSDFFVYIDEFQNMTSDSLPDVLSEARKFRVGITLANQFFSQVPERTRDAIMGNVGNRMTFRLGPKDADLFAGWLGRDVHPEDLIKLPNFVAVGALSTDGVPLDPMVVRTDPPLDVGDLGRGEVARDRSRERWARPVAELDEAFFGRWRHVRGSIAANVAARRPRPRAPMFESGPKPAPPSRSFLDEWLERRAEQKQRDGEAAGEHLEDANEGADGDAASQGDATPADGAGPADEAPADVS